MFGCMGFVDGGKICMEWGIEMEIGLELHCSDIVQSMYHFHLAVPCSDKLPISNTTHLDT
jgi:hypothetical protein